MPAFVRAFVLFLTMVVACGPALASDRFQEAVRLYNSHRYGEALSAFRRIVELEPKRANAHYYAALCLQKLGFPDQARLVYARIATTFPQTQAAKLSQQGLRYLSLDGKTLAPGQRSDFHDLLTAPTVSWIPFHRRDNSIYVDGSLNRAPLRMLFDTGASQTVLGLNHLAAAGCPLPTSPPDGTALGVGSKQPVPYWTVRVDLSVGKIRRRNFPVVVHEHMDVALLGQTFYRDFEYEIDNDSCTLSFRRRDDDREESVAAEGGVTVNAAGQYVYTVPFVRERNEIIVEVQVNGKPCRMYFDTGASICFFPGGALDALGIAVPSGADRMSLAGIGGGTSALAFPVAHMKLGPIDKTNVMVTTSAATTADKPLLGQNFFNDWQFTIDNKKRAIRFVRK